VELDFGKPTRFSSVYLTFDTDLNERSHSTPIVPDCVRDYTLSYSDGSQWRELAAAKGNFQRRAVHRFAPVEAASLRVNIQATNGAKSARIFEVRVYSE
jgi:hypothetical protein